MPEWLQFVNQINPISYVIEAIRALMVTGFDWNLIGQALLSILIMEVPCSRPAPCGRSTGSRAESRGVAEHLVGLSLAGWVG